MKNLAKSYDLETRQQLRQQLRAFRNGLSNAEQRRAEYLLSRQLLQQTEIKQARNIAFYHACGGEISPALFIQKWQRQYQRHTYCPIIFAQHKMRFAHSSKPMLKNRFGIPEPKTRSFKCIQSIDVILMPLLGFDLQGNRLGMGGGYYDRALAFKQRQTWRNKPLLIGLAHDGQQIEHVMAQTWDIPVDAIATTTRFIRFK
jgi:5-formyltetrahydrofolate cyclo-ligase